MDSDINRDTSRVSSGNSHDANHLTLFGQNRDSMARMLKVQHLANTQQSSHNSRENLVDVKVNVPHKKGSISGVFVPTCENMWGVLIFLKFFTIVGEGGFMRALFAVLLSAVTAYTTTICLTAIASSGGFVSEGGPYHMISRALGPNMGATVGVVYWAGMTLLAVMESKGAVHALELWPGLYDSVSSDWAQRLIGVGIMLFCSLSVFAGVNIVTKLGAIFALVVLFTIVLFYVGLFTASAVPAAGITGFTWATFSKNWTIDNPVSFGRTLSLFFPCFTGMLSGADRADVLADPPRNIRNGTFGALTLSLVMYLSFLFLWAGVGTPCALRRFDDVSECAAAGPLAEGHYDIVGAVIRNMDSRVTYAGIIISCIAQVLQCLMVAPRLLQAIGKDNIIPFLKIVSPSSKSGEPARALLATFIMGLVMMLALADMERAAQFVSICFLVCYAFLNLTCLLLTFLRTTTWRPEGIFHKRWRVWYIMSGLVGFLTSMYIMIEVGAVGSVAVFLVCVCLYFYCDWVGSEAEWGSGLDGIRFSVALKILMGLRDKQAQKINWRPQILVIYPDTVGSGLSPRNESAPTVFGNQSMVAESTLSGKHGNVQSLAPGEKRVLQFVAQLKKGKGMCVVAAVFEADQKTPAVRNQMAAEKRRIEQVMEQEELFGFAEVTQARSWGDGAPQVIQLCGLGGMRPNTVVFSWPTNWRESPNRAVDFVKVAKFALDEEKAVLCPKNLDALPLEEVKEGTIDLWWFIHDGGLLILLTWLLSQHRVWRHCKVRLFIVMEDVTAEEAEAAVLKLQKTLRRKNILPKGVQVEAVVLREDNLIAPYTYDWTLRAEKAKLKSQKSELPLILDDLFNQDEEKAADLKRSESLWARLTNEPEPEEPKSDDLEAPLSPRSKAVIVDVIEPLADYQTGLKRKAASDDELLTGVGERLRLQRKVLEKQLSALPEEETNSSEGHATGSSFERLNKVLLSKSKDSSLVLMNLPDIWGTSEEDCQAFLAYCECLTAGLERVIFAKSAGTEIFQLF